MTAWTREELGILFDQAVSLAKDAKLPFPEMCRDCFMDGESGWCNHHEAKVKPQGR